MQRRTLFRIVPEGWVVLGALVLAAIVVQALTNPWYLLPVVALIAAVAVYCRDTPRSVPAEPLAVVSPVDGTVVECGLCEDPFLNRRAIRVAIKVNWWGTYLLRSPVEGTIHELSGAVVGRERAVASWIRTDEGDETVLVIARGSLFGQHPCRSGFGERVGQGRCCGVRRLGRRVDLYLPVESRLEVTEGRSVRAGASVLAKLVHKKKCVRPPTGPSPMAGATG